MLENLIEQAFQQYGLVGLIIGFLILGPGFTYVQTKNARVRAENRAQVLLNELCQEERQHGAVLEAKLDDTLAKLDTAKSEIFQLRMELAETARNSEEIVKLIKRVKDLEDFSEQ